MQEQTVWFKDNFLSAGLTDILDGEGQVIGQLDLKSMFNSGIQVLDSKGSALASGGFTFFSNKWRVYDHYGSEIGILAARFSFLTKKFEYESSRHGSFEIRGEAFSREYDITSHSGRLAARFERVSGPLSARAYQLTNHSQLPTEEWIAVAMGVHAIQRRRQNAAT